MQEENKKRTAMKQLVILAIAVSLLAGCAENRETEFKYRTDVNDWIAETMQDVYIWNNELRESANRFAEPDVYFENLIYASDKFSYITTGNEADSLSASYGIAYRTYSMKSESSRILAQITAVADNSPAYKAGLKRGLWVIAANDMKLNNNNVTFLDRGGELKLEVADSVYLDDSGNETWTATEAVTVGASEIFTEPALHMDTIYDTGNGKHLYVVLNNLNLTDNDMETLKKAFIASRECNRVILDLRTCDKGDMKQATAISSMIAPEQQKNQIFTIINHNGNNKDKDTVYTFSEQLSAYSINKDELFVLTSATTSGAAEAIINGLKPYMNVYIIGSGTAGKNVILDKINCPVNTMYTIHPAVAQICDKDNASLFPNGFAPDSTITERDLMPIYELGDTRESLLNAAFVFRPKSDEEQQQD